MAPDDRIRTLFHQKLAALHLETDRLFFWLLLVQWGLAVALTLWGNADAAHVLLVVVGGLLVNVVPLVLIITRSGRPATRVTVAVAQIAWSVLVVEGTEGRFGTPFHLYGALAFLAFYRDPRTLILALATAGAAQLARTWAIADAPWWQFFEQSGWMGFEGVVLLDAAVRSRREMWSFAERETQLDQLREGVEAQVREKTAELEASREQYRALVEGSNAVPWEFDPRSFRFVYLSPQARQMLGVDLATLNADRMSRLVHRSDQRAVKRTLLSLARHAGPDRLEFECRVFNADGQLVDVRSWVSRSPRGATLIGISFDVTRQKRLELELRQAQKLESVGRLAAGVAHEINTPVQFVGDNVHFVRDAINGLSELIGRYRALVQQVAGSRLNDPLVAQIRAAERDAEVEYLLEQAPRALDRTLDGVARVAAIVRSMKDFAYPERMDMVATDLNRAIESTLTIARNEYKYVADLDLDLADLPPVVCHPGSIGQVVLNLVVNAAHAIGSKTSANGERGRIGVRTRLSRDAVIIEVSDTGGGIPSEIQERIFEPFFTTKQVGQGTGQGLALSRAVVVDRHHGSLTFRSELGVGTTFTVTLPLHSGATGRLPVDARAA